MPLFLPGDFSIQVEITPRFGRTDFYPFFTTQAWKARCLVPSCKILF